jgi:hypothetical protein
MKRISIKESKKFLPLENNFMGENLKNASYFTIEPHPDSILKKEGWEIVKYYTSKRKGIYENNNGEGNQWVYILSNPSIPGVLKIGYTNYSPELRAKQISSSTGVVVPYKVEWAFKCSDGFLLESKIHNALKDFRINNQREFFLIDLEEAKKIITLMEEN